MYISISSLFWGFIALLGILAIIYFVVVLHKFSKLITSVSSIISDNRKNIDKLCSDIPEITDNLKGVSEVITETTADVLIAKDNLLSNLEIFKDIINIIISVFSKKK